MVAVVAQYMYHRHDTRLPTLATLLLRRVAALFPMSILACLGKHAEPIRDVFLARLAAHTEVRCFKHVSSVSSFSAVSQNCMTVTTEASGQFPASLEK